MEIKSFNPAGDQKGLQVGAGLTARLKHRRVRFVVERGAVIYLKGMIKNIFLGLVAILHTYFMVLEMFLWQKPIGLKTFAMDAEQASKTAVLAGNQGLYNGFLVAGLVWALAHPDPAFGKQLALFFLGCVVVAGVYGAYTVNMRIFFIQGLPALIGMAAVFFT